MYRKVKLYDIHYLWQICRMTKKAFNNVATDWVGGQTSNRNSQISQWTTKTVPKTPVYVADLIRLCRADILLSLAVSCRAVSHICQAQIPTGPWPCLHCHQLRFEVIVVADISNSILLSAVAIAACGEAYISLIRRNYRQWDQTVKVSDLLNSVCTTRNISGCFQCQNLPTKQKIRI